MIGQRVQLNLNKDERGLLMAINRIPFDAKRQFFICNVPENAIRGNHYSKSSSFLYVAVKGKCKVELDNGVEKETVDLFEGDGFLFYPNTWMRIFDFKRDTILCVLSDKEYVASDYISDYEVFLKIVRNDNV